MVLPHVFEVAMEFVETHCGKYTAWQSECEQTAAKGEILLLKLEPLALSFDPRPCDETSLPAARPRIAPILPLMTLIKPGLGVAIPANRDVPHSDQLATI
jgi:hypothetical protein